ncbi:molybdopterin molybdotransferase MoeA [Marivita sp. S6314]|uniref:molybdopterin molybdotransferase MoeA n=1 Tax=Marivita sp. S6314 TaxID=2926406 RepID=UPI001FF6EDE3|nr:gephyrin-like molybdotransferase Glp [Marivita sp. S6314]MCK0151589.1 molybdopterin molybdotransferase MoeA [Marivita sp. S6314]
MHMDRTIGGCDCDSVLALGSLLSIPEAVDCALRRVTPIADVEDIAIAEAVGRITAKPVCAPMAMPLFDNAAMDGFAFCRSDLEGRCCLPVSGTVAAGDAPRALPAGTALRIYTGAPVPDGADTVVMIEACVDKTTKVHLNTVPAKGTNIRCHGSDQAQGQQIVPACTRLAPHHIGLLAANGIDTVSVVRRPRVAVFSTGDEVCKGALKPGQIPDANRPLLRALLRQAGAQVVDMGILPDEADATTHALRGMRDQVDLIVTTGAVSMGGKDHVQAALVAAGGTVDGWRVALKPGKPVMFGALGKTAFTGLPGNPFAAHVGFHLFLLPQLARLTGATPRAFASETGISGFDWDRKPGRAEVFPVRVTGRDTYGRPVLERLGRSVSATLLPLSEADGLAIVPADCIHVTNGTPVKWHPFCQTGAEQ